MGIFVDERGRPVTIGPNTIYVRTEFTVRQQMVLLELREAIQRGDPEAAERLLATLIARWEGPAFEGMECTPENIVRLNTADPLVQAAIAAYQEILGAMADPKRSRPATAGGGQRSAAAKVK